MSRAKWEYKVVRDALSETELNKLGEEGWELCGVTRGMIVAMYFKRLVD